MFGIPGKQAVTLTPSAAKQIARLMERQNSQGLRIGDYASGIYFVHVAFVALLIRHTGFERPAIWASAVIGSCVVVWGLRRMGLAARLL